MSPGAFINHHANRFKYKFMSQQHGSSGSSTSSPLTLPGSGGKISSSSWTTARNNSIILANAAAIELYFLCVEDEQDAEKLCTKCSEKFFLNLSLTETIAQAPLISSCIQVLGRLALKYPNLSKISVRHLTDFLTEPSPILFKQYKYIIEKLNTLKGANNNGAGPKSPVNQTGTIIIGTNSLRNAPVINNTNNDFQPHHTKTLSNINTKILNNDYSRSLSRNHTLSYRSGNVSYSKSTRIFEFLRDITIECLCL